MPGIRNQVRDARRAGAVQETSVIFTVYVVEGLSLAEPFDKIIVPRPNDRGCIGGYRRSQDSRPHLPACGIDDAGRGSLSTDEAEF